MKDASCTIAAQPRMYRFGHGQFWTLLVSLIGWLWASSHAQAEPPANDLCVNAEVIPSAGPFPYSSSLTPDINDATSTGDPDGCYTFVSRSTWYVFTPAESGFYRLSVSGDTDTTVRDTAMGLFTSSGGCGGPFTAVACNDDDGLAEPHLLQSAIATNLVAGTQYYVVVWMFGTYVDNPSQMAVQLRVSRPSVPANDTCAGAEVIPGEGPFPYLTAVTDTLLAHQLPGEPIPSCRERVYAERSVWYEFTPAQTTLFSISTCVGTKTTTYDTVLGLYTSPNGCAGPFEEVSCSDDGCGLRSDIRAVLTAGQKYYIAVYDAEQDPAVSETDVQLRITVPPEAQTFAATDISSAGATLNGYLRPNGVTTRWWFEYGTNTSYGSRTAIRLEFGSTPQTFTNALLSPLIPNQTYHFQLVASNFNGVAYGGDRSFVYSTQPPSLDVQSTARPGEPMNLIFDGSRGQIYEMQASTNLLHWEDQGRVEEYVPGVFLFVDPTTPLPPARFYRLKVP